MHLSVYLPIQYDGRGEWISHLGSLLAVLILDPLPKVLIHRSGVGPRNLPVTQAVPVMLMRWFSDPSQETLA